MSIGDNRYYKNQSFYLLMLFICRYVGDHINNVYLSLKHIDTH